MSTVTQTETHVVGGKAFHVQDVKLTQDIYLVRLRQHRWHGEHVIKKAKVAVAVSEAQVDDDMIKRVSATLIPKPLRRELSLGYAAVDQVLRRFTYDFSGSLAVSSGAIQAFFQELDQGRQRLAAAVQSFKARYETEVVAYNRAKWGPKLGDAYDEVIGQLLPPKHELDDRFGVDVVDIKKLEAPSAEYLAMAGLDASIIAEVKKHKAAEYAAAMDQLVEGPRRTLAEAIERLNQQLTEGEIIRRDSFNAVLDAIALNRAFAGTVTDQTLLDTSKDLEEKIIRAIGEAESQKNSTNTYSDLLAGHKDGLIAALGPVVAAANDNVAVAQVRKRLRVRTVDTD